MCDGQFLPFRYKIFNFLNCSHVLEHVINPRQMLQELKKIGKIIYIETPTWIREDFFCSNLYHKWVFIVREGKLCARKPKKGKNLMLDTLPFFNTFEYLINTILPIFFLKIVLQEP